MNRIQRSIILTAALGFVASCGYAAPYSSSGPAMSKEGVNVAIAGERCFVNRSAAQFSTTVGDDRLNLDLRLQIRNEASHTAVLSLDRLRVSETTGGERQVMQPLVSGALELAPGETKMVSLDFEQEGELDCHHDMALEAAGAIAIEGAQVNVGPIHFLSSR
jgi:hypothetical protein